MEIKKFKAELEEAIYEGPDGRFFIGERVVQRVLTQAGKQALIKSGVIKPFGCEWEGCWAIMDARGFITCDGCKRYL